MYFTYIEYIFLLYISINGNSVYVHLCMCSLSLGPSGVQVNMSSLNTCSSTQHCCPSALETVNAPPCPNSAGQ